MAGTPNDDELVDYEEYDPEEGANYEEAPVSGVAIEQKYDSDPTDFIRTEQKPISETKRDRSTSKMKDNSKSHRDRDSGKRRRDESRDPRERRRDNSRDRGDRHRNRSKDTSRDRGKDRNGDRDRDRDRDRGRDKYQDNQRNNHNNRYDKSRPDKSSKHHNNVRQHNHEHPAKVVTVDGDSKQPPVPAVADVASPSEGNAQASPWSNNASAFGYGAKNMFYGNSYNPTAAYANTGLQPAYPAYPNKPTTTDGSNNAESEPVEGASTAFNPPYPSNPSMAYANYDPNNTNNAMYNMQYGYPNYGYNFPAQPPLPPGYPPAYNQQKNYPNNHNNNYRKPKQTPSTPQLPEHERCTLLCTGIPTYVKEEDIRAHFESFGCIVELQISAMEKENSADAADSEQQGEKKKVYNECLVQFYSAQNAKKCFSSPMPVLNNRFIHLKFSKFNIMPPQDVEPPSMEEMERDRVLLTQDIIPQTTASQPGSRKKAAFNMYNKGLSNKWRRTDDGKFPGTNEEAKEGGEEHNESNVNQTSNETNRKSPVEGEEVANTEPAPAAPITNETPKKEISKEGLELKQNFEQLKSLKHQAEEILKKKETVLQAQMEKCRQMMDQLEKTPNSDSKATLQQNLEGKIVDLQAQLRTVREQIEKGLLADKQSPPPKQNMPFFNTGGRFGGRFGGSPRFHGGGRGYMGGRGRFGGRGFYAADVNQYDLHANAVATDGSASEYHQENAQSVTEV